MATRITGLLSAPDGYELVRDDIAQILADEIANQQVLAAAAGENPEDYALDVYAERFTPIEQWFDEGNQTPVATVWLSRYSNDRAKPTVNSDRGRATYYIDVFALGEDANNEAGGHIAGDRIARERAHRSIRYIRQILMSGQYTYLLSPQRTEQYVWDREVTEIEVAEARKREERSAQWIATARLTVSVSLKVANPQNYSVTWSGIDLTAKRLTGEPDGKVLARAQFDNT